MSPPEPSNRDTMAIVQQLPETRTPILHNQDCAAIAEAFLSDSLGVGQSSVARMVHGLLGGVPARSVCGCEADKRECCGDGACCVM